MRIGCLAAACALLFFTAPIAAQDSTRALQDSAVRVFLDCPDSFCDFDYYHTEITFVNWVRDRTYAQVHVLVTTQQTGGGQEYTLAFIGHERFLHRQLAQKPNPEPLLVSGLAIGLKWPSTLTPRSIRRV